MTRIDRRTQSPGFFQRYFMRFTGRLRRASDQAEGDDVDRRLDFAEVSLKRTDLSSVTEAFTHAPLPLGDARFVAREAARNAIEHGYAAWRNDRPRLIALVGPSGCGLTSLLNQVGGWFDDGVAVARLDLARRPDTVEDAIALAAGLFAPGGEGDTVDEVAAYLNTQPAQLILVDNGHFLYSRLMGSQEGIRAFLGLMVATQDRHLWVLACETQAWRRQCDAARTDRYFDDVITLDYLTCEEVSAVIAARHTPSQRSEDDDAPALNERQLDDLITVSRGHPALALHIVERVLSGEAEAIPAPFDDSPLRELERTELLALAEISAHGRLTATDLQSIFRRDSQSINTRLHHLMQSSLIAQEPVEGAEPAYRLQPLLAPVINAHLVRANYLY